MTDQPYTPREIDTKFDEMKFLWESHTKEEMLRFDLVYKEIKGFKEILDSHAKAEVEKLDLILQQTTKHNNRLSKNEYRIALLFGGLVVVGLVVVPLFLNIIQK